MRASRLLTILMLLQARGAATASELAAELEVSVRTIYRDIDQLAAAGVPVYAEQGRAGGYRLMEGWRTRLTGLTPGEAQALFLAGLPGPAAELGLAEEMAAARLKVLAALPAGWQSDALRISERFHLDPAGWYHAGAELEHLPEVAAAVWSGAMLRIRYESWTGVVEREVCPLGLVLKGGTWYLVAASGGSPRTFRLSNVLALAMLDRAGERPAGFDLTAYWAESTRRFEAELYRGEATVRVTPEGLRLLPRLSAAVAKAVAATSAAPDADGWTTLTIPIETIEYAAGELLKLGVEIEVLTPPELREWMREIAATLAARYGVSAGASGPSV